MCLQEGYGDTDKINKENKELIQELIDIDSELKFISEPESSNNANKAEKDGGK